jgi:hypothetical protein
MVVLLLVPAAAGGAALGYLAGGVVAPDGDPRSVALRVIAAVIGALVGAAVAVLTAATDRRAEKP